MVVYKSRLVHRIVAETFISNPKNKPYVNHKDNNPKNNRLYNLEWCTQKENVEHYCKLPKKIKDQKLHLDVLTNWKKSTIFSNLYLSKEGKIYNINTYKIKDPLIGYNEKRIFGKLCTTMNYKYHLLDILIATEFCNKPDQTYKFVVHKDSNENNCCSDNLYWSKKEIKCTILAVNNDYNKYSPWYKLIDIPNCLFSQTGKVWNIQKHRLLKLKISHAGSFVFNSIDKTKNFYVNRTIYCACNNLSLLDIDGFHIDHIDRDNQNNNITNLRKVTCKENNRNKCNNTKFQMEKDGNIEKFNTIVECLEKYPNFSRRIYIAIRKNITYKGYKFTKL